MTSATWAVVPPSWLGPAVRHHGKLVREILCFDRRESEFPLMRVLILVLLGTQKASCIALPSALHRTLS